jgi:hypothetical protein
MTALLQRVDAKEIQCPDLFRSTNGHMGGEHRHMFGRLGALSSPATRPSGCWLGEADRLPVPVVLRLERLIRREGGEQGSAYRDLPVTLANSEVDAPRSH